MQNPSIVCFGEVLWDMLPSGKVAGGAPMNVAYHARQLGLGSTMISSVGQDELGDELLRFLKQKDIPTHLVQRQADYPTSVVQVQLDEKGSASYEIVEGVAWDHIGLQEDMKTAVAEADAIVFGSLVTRSGTSRNTLIALLDVARLRVFDVNFRAPFYSQDSIEALLQRADLVKTNDEELEIMAGWYGQTGDMATLATYLLNKFQLQKVIVTRGAAGALCCDANGLHEHSGFPVEVQDTVGSGDSFLAGFLTASLQGKAPAAALGFACAVGALVATRSGGTPAIDQEMVRGFLEERGEQLLE